MRKAEAASLFRVGSGLRATSLLHYGAWPSAWRVDVVSGPLPSMGGWPLRHEKRFENGSQFGGGFVTGVNVFRGRLSWGRFRIFEEYSEVAGSWGHSLIFCYDTKGAAWPVRRMVDYVRATDDFGLLVGAYGFEEKGLPGHRSRLFHLLGYFTMTRLP